MTEEAIHGIATIKRNGENLIVDVAAKLKIGGTVNNRKMVGYKSYPSQRIVMSELEAQIPFTERTDLIKEQSMTGVEIQFQSDNGAVYVIPTASQTNEIDTGEEGLVNVVYMGDPAQKV